MSRRSLRSPSAWAGNSDTWRIERRLRVAEGQFILIATYLPVRRWRHVLPFMLMSYRVAKQAKKASGLVKHALKADFPRLQFWTLLVWNDRRSVSDFVRSEPHKTAVGKFNQWAGEGAAFAEWTSRNDAINWPEALERLKTPRFYYKR